MKKEEAKVGMTVRVWGSLGNIIQIGEDGARVAFPNGYEAGYYYRDIHIPRK